METVVRTAKIDTWSSNFTGVEFADDFKRAILTIPLFHVGANKKGLYWTPEMLQKIASMYRGVPFRFDLGGTEGSSHTPNKLSSPFFDVGWTFRSEDGAWYDSKTKTLWVKGEVTHPDVISKLSRQTSDGQREINYASMGALVEEAICSVCGREYTEDGFQSCDHERNKPYNGQMAYKVPTEVSKALHVALTNDPADGEAEIKDCIFQDMGGQDLRQQAGKQGGPMDFTNQMAQGMAPAAPATNQPGEVLSPEMLLKHLAERIKTIENKIAELGPAMVNANPMAPNPTNLGSIPPKNQMSQSGQGTTQAGTSSHFEAKADQNGPNSEGKDMEMAKKASDAQSSMEKKPVNPAPMNKEMQDGMAQGGSLDRLCALLEQLLAKMSGGQQEMQDAGDEKPLLNASKGEAVNHHDPKVEAKEHQAPGEPVSSGSEEHESNKKNKENLSKPGMVATADAGKDSAKNELADLKSEIKALRAKLEAQDSNVPEFGGVSGSSRKVEVQDMTAKDRREAYGEYGAWDAIFKGHESASRFKR